jgi:hypothetical protein
MTAGPAPQDYPPLPGPLRFVSDIAADLSDGKSAVIVFPDSVVDSGIADAILDELRIQGVRSEFLTQSGGAFPARILSTFGSDRVAADAFDEWDSIIAWEAWHESWVVIPGWEHGDVAEIVTRWPAQVKACGLPIDERPKLIIGVRLTDLPRTTITHLDRDSVAVHWWWGVLDRLDTETRLAAVSPRRISPVHAAVITEVAGWDLRCTDFLAEHWDWTTAGLPAALQLYQQQVSCSRQAACTTPTSLQHGASVPPVEVERAWQDGLVDRWGYSIRPAPHILDESGVTQRLWMAHNRILIPHVEEERAVFERLVMARASSAALEGLNRRDDDIVEIGSLAWLVNTGRVRIGREPRMRLQAFRDLRNDLAHHRPVSDRLLREIAAYLGF